jgi:hypothetical protein
MLSWMREKFGPIIIGLIIGLIAFVFVFYGVFSPKATKGLHEGAVAGKVNGDSISIQEFNRELGRRVEYLKNMTGGKLTDDQLKAFRLKSMVFDELVSRKLLSQAALKSGLVASDEEIKTRIQEMPVFQKDGKFDTLLYKQVLEANNYNPAAFERIMREDLSLQLWNKYFRDRVKISDEELKREYLANNDKRNIKFVLLTTDIDKKPAPPEKAGEISKANEKIIDQILPLLAAGKTNDAKINALLKSNGVEVKTTGLVSRANTNLPGIGEARELTADAFMAKSPIDLTQGGKAKKYNSGNWWMAAVVIENQSPDLAKLDAEREQLLGQLSMKKERDMYEAFMKKLSDKAKIEKNSSVVNDDSATS